MIKAKLSKPWLAEFVETSKEYADSWVCGWNLHRCDNSLAGVEETQKNNNAYWANAKKPELKNKGMTDGWKARESAFPKKKR